MNDSETSLKHQPFGKLGKRLKTGMGSCHSLVPKSSPKPDPDSSTENDEGAFLKAMQGVKVIARDKFAGKRGERQAARLKIPKPDMIAMTDLDNLIKYGEGFIVANTPEYMAGTGRNIPPAVAERLHRGDFSIQAHIDLHGMGVEQAKGAFEEFLSGSITSGKRAILVIHGRGLSSPGEPVLKNKVRDWLTRSHWRKWVIAFSSAQCYDGGAGATYILLRRRPAPKKCR